MMLARPRLLFSGPHAAAQVAYLVYVVCGAIASLAVKYRFLEYTLNQLAGIFVLYNVMRLLGSSRFVKLAVAMRLHVGGATPTFGRKWAAYWLSLSIYQIPLYCISAVLVGADRYQVFGLVPLCLGEIFLGAFLFGGANELICAYRARRAKESSE